MIRVVKVNGLRGDARLGVCYVGRAFAGWPKSPWANPFKMKPYGPGDSVLVFVREWENRERERVLAEFRAWVASRPDLDEWLDFLWRMCDRGEKPLGCWCVNATVGDGQPVVCHAQILAELLHDRFGGNDEKAES